MSEITSDSIGTELNEIADSAESLAQAESSVNSGDKGDLILGWLFASIHKLNYLLQSQLSDKSNLTAAASAPAEIGSRAILPSSGLDILNEFNAWIQIIKRALSQIAKILHAASYSIGVQVPFGVSVSITFTP
ncbi:MAG: hypothetical protein ACYC7D_00665 [Nitrososphaerales archaeon]